MAELTDSDIQAKAEEEAWLQEVQEPIKQKFREREQALKKDEAPSPEPQAKMEEHSLQEMAAVLNRGQGVAMGGLYGYDPAADIRSRAFASAMQVHAHRTTNHNEILECARAFEAYLKGE